MCIVYQFRQNPFSCEKCEKSFVEKGNMTEQKLKHHGKDNQGEIVCLSHPTP